MHRAVTGCHLCTGQSVNQPPFAGFCHLLKSNSFFYNKKRALFVFFVDYPEEARSQQLEMRNKGH